MEKYIAENINRHYDARLAGFAAGMQHHYKKSRIHDFRVDIKKLRAFYRLQSLQTGGEHTLTLPRKLKKMYRGLGKIRDLQQHKESLETWARKTGSAAPGHLLAGLKHQLKKHKARKGLVLPGKYFAQQAEKINRQLPERFRMETLQSFFRQKKEAIRLLIEKDRLADDELHAIRKHLKDMLYVYAIYTEDLKSALPLLFLQPGETEKMDSLAQDIGRYNDARNGLAWLQRSTTGYKGRDKKELMLYYNAQVQEKKALKHKIIPLLQSMFLPAKPPTAIS
jgi:CHAD domain-containing protein